MFTTSFVLWRKIKKCDAAPARRCSNRSFNFNVARQLHGESRTLDGNTVYIIFSLWFVGRGRRTLKGYTVLEYTTRDVAIPVPGVVPVWFP